MQYVPHFFAGFLLLLPFASIAESTVEEAKTTVNSEENPALPVKEEILYIVDSQVQTLGGIAIRLYGGYSNWKKLAEWNNLKAPYHLKFGQVLVLKEAPTLTLREGDEKLEEMRSGKISNTPSKTPSKAKN